MSNTILSPNMGLPVPVPGVDPGPDYANNNGASFIKIDSHNHSAGQGVQIQPNGLNISSDLTFQLNNATNLRSARLATNTVALAGASDLGAVYNLNGNLYWNNNGGTAVQITNGSSIVGTAGSITGLPSGTAGVSYAGGTYVFQSATNTSAIIDAGSVIIRNATASSKGITVSAPNALANNTNFVLPIPPASATSFLQMDTSGNVTTTVAVANGLTSANIANGSIIQASLAPRASGSTVAAGGVATAFQGSGSISTSAISPFAVTALSVTITTTGRPVMVMIVAEGSQSFFSLTGPATQNGALFGLFRGGSTPIATATIQGNSGSNNYYVPPSLSGVDFVAAGTYTYSMSIWGFSGSNSTSISGCQIVAYEL